MHQRREVGPSGTGPRCERWVWPMKLRPNCVGGPALSRCCKESFDPDGSSKTKLSPFSPLETSLKLIESAAVDQHADHIMALTLDHQVEFRVRDGAEAMISAVRNFLDRETNTQS